MHHNQGLSHRQGPSRVLNRGPVLLRKLQYMSGHFRYPQLSVCAREEDYQGLGVGGAAIQRVCERLRRIRLLYKDLCTRVVTMRIIPTVQTVYALI